MSMKKLILINAIVWAAIILLSAYWFKDHENYVYLFGTLIVGAGLMNALIYQAERRENARKCLK